MIFLPYGIVMPLWFICPWLSSCVLCCKSVGAHYFLGMEQKRRDFSYFTFLAENQWRNRVCTTAT